MADAKACCTLVTPKTPHATKHEENWPRVRFTGDLLCFLEQVRIGL